MKSTDPGDRVLGVQQARTAANRYKEHGLPEAVTDEVAVPPDNRTKYLKASLTHEKARGRGR